MIDVAAQTNTVILVIFFKNILTVKLKFQVTFACKDEFETDFEAYDQTREHAILVKVVDVRYLVG